MSTQKMIEINNECIICLDIIDDNNQEINFFKGCDHNNFYHIECVNNWINECNHKNMVPTCPICRKEVVLREITIVIPNEIIMTPQNNQVISYCSSRTRLLLNHYNHIGTKCIHILGCISTFFLCGFFLNGFYPLPKK